jgi:hypothetical protein
MTTLHHVAAKLIKTVIYFLSLNVVGKGRRWNILLRHRTFGQSFKTMRSLIQQLSLLLLLSLVTLSCGETAPAEVTPDSALRVAPPPPPKPRPATLQEEDELFTWVDKVNVRNAANTKGKVVGRIPAGEPMVYLGKKMNTEEIVLRGVVYNEPWLQIRMKDGKEGWVFGGAVHRKQEVKGNPPVSATKISFPHFGRYDLADWTKISTKEGDSEEVDQTITTYQQDSRLIEVDAYEIGDYGYGYTYKLMDVEKRILIERKFVCSADTELRTLEETVTSYMKSPTRIFTRKQNLENHFSQLNSKPVMVNGDWIEGTINPVDGSVRE